MAHKLDYLPLALADILEAEAYLYGYSPAAADKFANEIHRLADTLAKHPLMYQAYVDDGYFRGMPLPYGYRLFYHVDEESATVKIHRVLRGMRDIKNTWLEDLWPTE
ncbi:MAG: type II toxin-antitoxin system RelE/ParE family toxin [Clostridiales bacterium]|jgi:plasmid stabilization system protein ParE|nr:type II toxin-antitoxin system RelE/ParE family toxin [Clostridiales bacterium]